MKKRGDTKAERRELDEFQAYGEYSYAYLHQENEESEGGSSPLPEPPPPPRAPKRQRAVKRRKTSAFFKLLGLLTFLTVLLIVLEETVFRLDTVYVVGNETKTPQEIVMVSGLVKGRNIFTISAEEVARAMEEDHTVLLKDMQIEYPSTVYLYVEERRAVAVMRWLGTQYELDETGLVMSESSDMTLPTGMPLITGFHIGNAHEGQRLVTRSAKQLEAYQAMMTELTLQGYADQVTEINLSNLSSLILITVEGITVRLGGSDYMQAKIGAVRTDMAYLRQLGKTSGMLDVSIPEDAKFMPED